MKQKFLAILFMLLCAVCAQAAVVVDTYDEGKAKVGEDGFIVVVYPLGWNPKNEALGKAIVNSPEFAKAAGNAVIMGMGLPNTSTKEMTDGRARKVGPIKLPVGTGVTLSYPVIYMCEADGRNYAIINANEFRDPSKTGADFTQTAITRASKHVANRLAAIKKQRALLAKAKAATGKERVDLIAEACNIPGINRPDNAVALAKEADPEDQYGLVAALNHNTYAFIEQSATPDDWRARVEMIEKMLKNPYYTPTQRQTLYTSAIGLLRRNGGPAEREKMLRYISEMRAVDPKSIYGRSAEGALRLWDTWSTEWHPDTIPATNGPMEIAAPSIKQPGTYTVTFNFSRGKHAFTASSVQLYDGDTLVAEDAHRCFAGNRHTDHVYTLTVKKKVSKPRLIIQTTMGNNRDSHGVITIMQE